MEWVKDLEEYIEKLSEKKGEKTYNPRKTTIDKVKKKTEGFVLSKIYDRVIATSSDSYYYSEREWIEELTEIKREKYKIMNSDKKDEIYKILEEKIKSFDFMSYTYFIGNIFGDKIVAEKERLKLITSGKNIKEYTFLNEEEIKKIHGYVVNIGLIIIKKEMAYIENDEAKELYKDDMLKLITTNVKSQRTYQRMKSYIISKTFLEKDEKEVKDEYKKWYKKHFNGRLESQLLKFIENDIGLEYDFEYFVYLLDDENKKRYVDKNLEILKTKFEKIKNEKSKNGLSKAKSIKYEVDNFKKII